MPAAHPVGPPIPAGQHETGQHVGTFEVSLDGGYVHSARQRSRRDGWFEVIAGKSVPTDGPAKCFGFVQVYDTKPKRRLFEALAARGMFSGGHAVPH